MSQDGPKRVKTTHEENGAARARTRVSRACNRCRARKDKCDGNQPACSNCVGVEALCSYDAATKKRGLPEGYVRAVEKLWAVSFSRVDGLEDLLVDMLHQDRDLLANIWNSREVGEELHSRWKDSRIFQELEIFLTSVDLVTATSGAKRKRERDEDEEIESVKDLSIILPIKYAICEPSTQQSAEQLSYIRQPPTVRTINLPSASSALLSRYFASIHACLPILDRPKLLRSCYEQAQSGTQIEESNDELAVLAAALACTAKTTPLSNELLSEPGMNADILLDIAKRCIPALSGTFKIGHVQALILMAYFEITSGDWESAWRSIGLVARVLNDFTEKSGGMSRDQTAARQGCLVLDTLVGIKLRRRPQCRRDDLPANVFLREDVQEEWEPWQGTSEPAFIISCFNHLTRLAGILSDFVCQLPGTPVPARDRTEQALGNMNTLAASYPRGARLTSAGTAPPHQMYLKVAHLLGTAFVTASHPDHVNSTIPPLATALKALNDAKAATSLESMPAWLGGLVSAVTYDLSELPSGVNLISSSKHAALFQSLDLLLRTAPPPSGVAPRESLQMLQQPTQMSPAPVPQRQSMSQPRKSFFPPDPFAQPMNLIQPPSPVTAAPPAANIDGSNMFVQTPQNFWANSIDIPTGPALLQNGGPSMPTSRDISSAMYDPSIATSPSFQGDEIDALFHEMAQLDTTEWATGRHQGLKDFGFNDMEAFDQFCNDPDRLFSNTLTGTQLQTLDQRHMSDFTMTDFDQHVQGMPAGFDMQNANWNG